VLFVTLRIFSGQGPVGSETSMAAQFNVQALGVIATAIYTAVVTGMILLVIKMMVGLRVNDDEETEGLDIVSHGERGYDI